MTDTWVMKIMVDMPVDKIEHMTKIIEGKMTTRYLKTFHPDRHGGRGEITFANEIADARKFDSFDAVMDCWKTQSKVRPLRDDGKPNRPLTAFTIQPHKLD